MCIGIVTAKSIDETVISQHHEYQMLKSIDLFKNVISLFALLQNVENLK